MREKLKENIHNFLKNYEGFFHSESEIQIQLAKYLLNLDSYDNVFVEYNVSKDLIPDYPWKNDNKISIDIVIHHEDNYIPIEIKFKTKSQTFPHQVFGSETNVSLLNQGAQNEGCYSFWKDLRRLEIIKEAFQLNHSGIVLFITNDQSYLNEPRQNVQYGPFSIHQERRVSNGEVLKWDAALREIKTSRAQRFPELKMSNDYTINWNDLKITNHKYLLV